MPKTSNETKLETCQGSLDRIGVPAVRGLEPNSLSAFAHYARHSASSPNPSRSLLPQTAIYACKARQRLPRARRIVGTNEDVRRLLTAFWHDCRYTFEVVVVV
jgi:hypothetical protein